MNYQEKHSLPLESGGDPFHYGQVNQKIDQPYASNKEYLSDWFAYTKKLYELHFYDYKEIQFDAELDDRWTHKVFALQRNFYYPTCFRLKD